MFSKLNAKKDLMFSKVTHQDCVIRPLWVKTGKSCKSLAPLFRDLYYKQNGFYDLAYLPFLAPTVFRRDNDNNLKIHDCFNLPWTME